MHCVNPASKRCHGKSRRGSAASERWLRTNPAGTVLAGILLLCATAAAVTKPHVVSFGKWTSAQWQPVDEQQFPIKIRALLVDGRVKEFTLGPAHDITDRTFVVRRAFRVNDSLPDDSAPRWQWQRGGWLLVDRLTGRISPIVLADFDPFYSAASWYRDYAAYCGVADDGKKLYAIVSQVGRRKPVLKKPLSDKGLPDDAAPDSACPAPPWQRSPIRVSFELAGAPKQTFAIRGHVVDVVNDEDEEEADVK